MKTHTIIVLTFPLAMLLASCSPINHPPSDTPIATQTSQTDPYKNHIFPCPTDQVVEPDKGYPFPIHQDEGAKKSVAELKEFCNEMRQNFKQSNLTIAEANRLYSVLSTDIEISPSFHNECYGMPVCETEPFIYDQQIMMKKISDTEFEIFYYKIGCGINYYHMGLSIREGRIQEYNYFQIWSESFPC